jgi:hypothetical protein
VTVCWRKDRGPGGVLTYTWSAASVNQSCVQLGQNRKASIGRARRGRVRAKGQLEWNAQGGSRARSTHREGRRREKKRERGRGRERWLTKQRRIHTSSTPFSLLLTKGRSELTTPDPIMPSSRFFTGSSLDPASAGNYGDNQKGPGPGRAASLPRRATVTDGSQELDTGWPGTGNEIRSAKVDSALARGRAECQRRGPVVAGDVGWSNGWSATRFRTSSGRREESLRRMGVGRRSQERAEASTYTAVNEHWSPPRGGGRPPPLTNSLYHSPDP